MINTKDITVDVEEMRDWANAYRDSFDPPLSWAKFGKQCDIPAGTLQPFCMGTYAGDNVKQARKLFLFMQSVESRAAKQATIPVDPGYVETETSLRIRDLLQLAHTGRMTAIATGPGTGKTLTVLDYAQRAGPVWHVTMSPSTSKLTSMVREVQQKLTLEIRWGQTAAASRMVRERIKDRDGLLVIDEAQHLTFESLEEIRGWHDATGVGVCLMGNEDLIDRIESGRHADAYGRLNSRIAFRHVQRLPVPRDVDVFCDAWQIEDRAMRSYLEKIARTPRSGGLRECRMLIEAGSMVAAGEDRGLTIADLREAQQTRATKWIAA